MNHEQTNQPNCVCGHEKGDHNLGDNSGAGCRICPHPVCFAYRPASDLSGDELRNMTHREFEEKHLGYDTRAGEQSYGNYQLSDRRDSTEGQEGDEWRKRPVTVKARQWQKMGDHPSVLRKWSNKSDYRCPKCGNAWGEHGSIKTLEDSDDGEHFVCPGDWIITGVNGEHYACKPDIFAKTYERPSASDSVALLAAYRTALEELVHDIHRASILSTHNQQWRVLNAALKQAQDVIGKTAP